MHIYQWQIDCTPQSIKHRCLPYCYTKPGRSSRYSTMHIYPLQIDPSPLLQLSIDLWKTITPNMFHIHPYTHCRLTPPPLLQSIIDLWKTITPIYITYIAQCIYTHGGLTAPLSQLSIDALTTAAANLADLADIAQCTYTHCRLTPLPSSN